MFSRRSILLTLVLLPRLVAHSADGSDALDRYNARLDEIARSYKQQFADIRKNQRRIGSGKTDFRAGEQQIKELGMMRSAAIAEAKLIFEKEQKQTDQASPSRLSREERQRELMAARRQLFEEGQKAFWERVAREEPKIAELMAARREAVEEEQTAFWAGLFETPKAIRHNGPSVASAQVGTQRAEKQTSPQPQQKSTIVQVQNAPLLAAAH